jgi:REP element-mobilizing transposase RayT
MNIIADEIYHIYNQGNNRESIFKTDKDYIEFLQLFRRFVFPHCKVLAYCLMPNHFHFEIYATEHSASIKKIGNIESSELSNGFRLLQSNYAQSFNKRQNRSGSLFRQKAKAKGMSDGDSNYGYIAFHYIHQNPIKAKLVSKLEDWPYSSFNDYAGCRNGNLCDRELAWQLIGYDKANFISESYSMIDEEISNKIFLKDEFY